MYFSFTSFETNKTKRPSVRQSEEMELWNARNLKFSALEVKLKLVYSGPCLWCKSRNVRLRACLFIEIKIQRPILYYYFEMWRPLHYTNLNRVVFVLIPLKLSKDGWYKFWNKIMAIFNKNKSTNWFIKNHKRSINANKVVSIL